MSDRAAIQAQLVDMRNVGTHKSLKITLHVPEEYALKAIEIFGWPTGAHPVPVALARINVEATEVAPKPPPVPGTSLTVGARDTRLSRRAALLCKDDLFHRFIERCTGAMDINETSAAEYIRLKCGVDSRSQILPGTQAAQELSDLEDDFHLWREAPKFAEQHEA